ncbi:MAG: isoaspartyl peptidase/L-asparaginase, partial [Hyphomicrobiales bacterium]|nr:isoaspartyl peptidase/L-asparaginase [Hyphomicrobiales bacterium]
RCVMLNSVIIPKCNAVFLPLKTTLIHAVQATIMVLEDSPHFNAGYGAALTENFDHEFDASIMDGATLDAGAVTSIKRVRNPIQAARAVLDGGKAVLLTGQAADQFAEQAGLTMVKPDYFTTQRRIDAVKSLKQRALSGTIAKASEAEKHGTVGAVARDSQGHLAAGTSTGGFNNKPQGRVGDSPIIGAGTYARDGVSRCRAPDRARSLSAALPPMMWRHG